MVDLPRLKRIATFVTVADLCEIFGVSRQAIYNWINKGTLPPKRRLGGVTGWDPDELRKFLRVRS